MLDGEVLTHVINTSLQLIEDINLTISIGYYNKQMFIIMESRCHNEKGSTSN